MKIFAVRIRPIHFKITIPLLAIWVVSLAWSANHHIENQRYRLSYLAKGVQQIARRNAALINAAEAGRITCESVQGQSGQDCGARDPRTGLVACQFSGDCAYRFGTERARLQAALVETVKDLQYLPYFSELYRERVLAREKQDKEFSFRIEVQRVLPGGRFALVDGLAVPSGGAYKFGQPVPLYAAAPAARARAREAWEFGKMTEFVTEAHYQLFWPLEHEGKIQALLTIQVEREQQSTEYAVGLVIMLSLWFIVLTLITAVSSMIYGAIWLVNLVPLWVTVLLLLGVFAALVYFRAQLAALIKLLIGRGHGRKTA
ncbi:MAG: hypothetical protein O7A69_12480 [SAR324 cluster bacterium]|nr:hypothetical protein [SAR324 cluster bacterium]